MQANGHISLEDKQTFEYVFDKYAPALAFFATRLLGNQHDAEDIVCETFIKLWQRRNGFHLETQVKAFLYIATRNLCFNTIKKRKNADNIRATYEGIQDDADPCVLDSMVRSEVLREIHCQVQGLPPECRKITLMRILGWQNDQIAKELNISISTVKNQYARAVYLIRKKIHTEKGGKPYR